LLLQLEEGQLLLLLLLLWRPHSDLASPRIEQGRPEDAGVPGVGAWGAALPALAKAPTTRAGGPSAESCGRVWWQCRKKREGVMSRMRHPWKGRAI